MWDDHPTCFEPLFERAQPVSQDRTLSSANSGGQQGTGVSLLLLLSFATLGMEHADCPTVLTELDAKPVVSARKL